MGLQLFSSYYFFLGFLLVYLFCFSGNLYVYCSDFCYFSSFYTCSIFGQCSYMSFIFSFLSIVLGISLLCINSSLGISSSLAIVLSITFSIICYNTSNSLLFWVCYELSILLLLILLIVDSPYSERYLASWYFLGYIVFTSLPMFLCILFISLSVGSFNMIDFISCSSYYSISMQVCIIILAVMFITKIPLFPFHCWLPIVHAESPSAVSVCLSGYIMKLGVVGLYRFCWHLLPSILFSIKYAVLVMCVSLLFFLCASFELDGKRWLAFLSLSHISIVCVGGCVCDYLSVSLPWYFCLGHGFSAGSCFILLWLFYDLSGSRNWFILKNFIFNVSIISIISVFCLFSVASVPTTITFFSEVLILKDCLGYNLLLGILMCFYIFLGGLVPLFILGHVFSCGFSQSIKYSGCWCYICSLVFISFWIFSIFLVL